MYKQYITLEYPFLSPKCYNKINMTKVRNQFKSNKYYIKIMIKLNKYLNILNHFFKNLRLQYYKLYLLK